VLQLAAATVAIGAALVLAGCGSNEASPTTPAQLSPDEQAAVRQGQREVRSYCQKLVLYLARRRGAPTQAETQRAFSAVDQLEQIARAKPAATLPLAGRTVRELLGDLAEELEGSNCAANIVQRLDQALAALPAG
jgi:hypothetical protein